MLASERDQYTISVKTVQKSYGEKKVLNDFCMKVPRGCIYGLLGASGCGKTTLLNCILGLRQVDYGDICVLGGKPRTPESGVPGPAVGYMPQDIALAAEFTVREAVYYFGRIYELDDWCIEERFEALRVLLSLPPDDSQLKHCSGGEQRRVSLAAAMVHKPPLLILDEPTVGLDPVLRDTIWNHLVEMSEKDGTTIVITTHYIEEARRAHKIGLMREGKLLVEESPERLLQVFNTESLEDVFLILSQYQAQGRLSHALQELTKCSVTTAPLEDSGSTDLLHPVPIEKKQINRNISAFGLNKHRLQSLIVKNTKQFLRNLSGMSFVFSFPILLVMAYLSAVGRDPRALKLGIVNDDAHFERCANYNKNDTATTDGLGNCHFTNLACRFVNDINNPMFDMEYYDNLHDAFEDVRHGEIVGVLHMEQNFSEAYSKRIDDGRFASAETLKVSEIKVWLDESNYAIGDIAKTHLSRLFKEFQISAYKDCNYVDKFGRFPMRFTFEYGIEEADFTDFIVPGMLLSVTFWSSIMLTSTIMVTERQEGLWDRSIVAGVSALEIVITHFATQSILVLIQTCELIIVTFVFYNRPYEGDLYLIFLFILLEGLAGMAFGFWISVISTNHTAANIISTGLFFPMLMLCGVFWPIEGQADGLRHLAKCLPFTEPIVSLRQVIKKGYGLDEWKVWDGMCVAILWILIILLISLFGIKARQ